MFEDRGPHWPNGSRRFPGQLQTEGFISLPLTAIRPGPTVQLLAAHEVARQHRTGHLCSTSSGWMTRVLKKRLRDGCLLESQTSFVTGHERIVGRRRPVGAKDSSVASYFEKAAASRLTRSFPDARSLFARRLFGLLKVLVGFVLPSAERISSPAHNVVHLT
jgi:hypothetical protein